MRSLQRPNTRSDSPILRHQSIRLACSPVKPGQQTILTVIVWLAPVLALPLHLMAFINAGLSAGVPSITFGQLVLFGIAPLISLLLCLAILLWGKMTVLLTAG